MTAVTINKSHINNLANFFKNRINGMVQSCAPSILKENDYPIVNDRLLINVVITLEEEIVNKEELIKYLTKELKEYFDNQNIICNLPIVSIYKI